VLIGWWLQTDRWGQMPEYTALNSLKAELNPICHLIALLGGATIVVVSRLRVKQHDEEYDVSLTVHRC
jgi:hypothetical protein